MRIKRLEIYGYGKWVDTTFVLTENVHLFYGQNEAGKSTLMSYIHSILFGFPTRSSILLRYEPKESSKYGGRVIAEDARFGEVIIERTHGKVTGDVAVTLEDGTTGGDELLDSILYGIDRTMFQNIFSFSLTDIEGVHKLNKNQLSRYLLTVGTHGTEHYLELADQFHADADKLYRPSGRVLQLNKHLERMKKQEEQLIALEQNNENYLNLIEQNKQEKAELNKVEEKENQLKDKLSDLQAFKKQHHVLQEIQTLTKEITTSDLPPLKKDGRSLLEEYKRELANLQTQLQEVKDKQKTQLDAFEHGELLEKYQENQEAIDALENDLPDLIETLSAYENVKERLLETKEQIHYLKQALSLGVMAKAPQPFTQKNQQTVQALLAKHEHLMAAEEKLSARILEMQNDLNLKNQQLDQYEEMMWDASELKEAQTTLNAGQTIESAPANRTPLVLSLLLALGLGLGAFFIGPPLNGLLGLLAVLSLVLGILLSRRKSTVEPRDNTYLKKELKRQQTLKDEWQDALSDLDAKQADFQALLQEKDILLERQKGLEEEWRNLLAAHLLPAHLSFLEANKVMEETNQLSQWLKTENEQKANQTELQTLLEEKTAPILEVLALEATTTYGDRVASFRNYHTRLRQEITKEQEKIQQLNAWNHEEKQIKRRVQTTQEKTRLLLETADTKTEEEFVELYNQKEALDKKKSRLKFLKENAPAFDPTKKLPTKEELDKQEEGLRERLKGVLTSKRAALRKQANTQLSIERLEKDGTYTDALQAFENQKATAQRLVDEWVADKLAAGMLQQTLSQVTNDRFREILADGETYFVLLTDGEYEKIVFQDEALFVQDAAGQLVDVRELSRGTAEPLYVAIRLAYIKNTQDMMELPIIMDDPFVNFDQQRRHNMYRLLSKLSEDLQLIYFTFDPEVLAYFTENQITHLETRKKNG